jgi:hypothetical protein
MKTMGKEGFEAVRIFFTGVGGQGTLVATRLVGEAALEEGMPVTLSEIHGMASEGASWSPRWSWATSSVPPLRMERPTS